MTKNEKLRETNIILSATNSHEHSLCYCNSSKLNFYPNARNQIWMQGGIMLLQR